MPYKKILSVVWDYFLLTVGTVIYCLAWTSFIQPNGIFAGELYPFAVFFDFERNFIIENTVLMQCLREREQDIFFCNFGFKFGFFCKFRS